MSVARTLLSGDPLQPAEFLAAVEGDDRGAGILFVGAVRDHDHGRVVTALHYEAHPNAAEALARITSIVAERHPAATLAAAHRYGDLVVGDVAFVAAAASAHRGEAFTALLDLVDTVKTELPVWKRQTFADGAHEWVNCA